MRVPRRDTGAEQLVVVLKSVQCRWSEGVVLSGFSDAVNQRWEEPITKTKPFSISKQVVWEAYRRVKANQRGSGSRWAVDQRF